MIDLHTHTTASDGSCSPAELLRLAKEVSLEALAVTDHDTLAGLPEAQDAAEELGIEFVPGLELACQSPVGTMHMLAYFIDRNNPDLQKLLADMVRSRRNRNPRIVAKLSELGYQMTVAEVQARASSDIVSRLHIALLMVEKGYVRSVDEAFGRFLGIDGAAYVKRQEPAPAEAIETIHAAGGLAVLAHAVHLQATSEKELNRRIEDLADLGLDGLEVSYPEHGARLTAQLWRICNRLDLAAVGGSDFHGNGKTHIKLGTGRGSLHIPVQILTLLKARLR